MEGTVFTYIFSRYLLHSYFKNSLPLFCINGCLEGGGRLCRPSPFPYSAMLFGHECQTTWQNMEMGRGWHSFPPSKQSLIQNNLEMYRNLKGTVYRSPVQKDIKPTFFESNCSLREPDMNMQRYVTSNFIWHCLPLCRMFHTVGCFS